MKSEMCVSLRSLLYHSKGTDFTSFGINDLSKNYEYAVPYTNITTEATQ